MTVSADELFDRVGDAYDAEVAGALGPFAREHGRFLEAKARWLLRLAWSRPERAGNPRVLDLGCGLGLLEPYLNGLAKPVFGAEVALAPLVAGRRPELASVLYGSILPFRAGTFDLVFMSAVLHHVPPEGRRPVLRELRRVLRPDGMAVFFEHNPWNPGTRWVVSRCEFDRDAVLLTPSELGRSLRAAGLRPVLRRHLLVTPWSGRFFEALDRSLAWLPLGAQYVVAAVRGEGGEQSAPEAGAG